jgi:hypothetical protein
MIMTRAIGSDITLSVGICEKDFGCVSYRNMELTQGETVLSVHQVL